MHNTFYKGRLKRWNEDKGFGFIESENGKNDIFIHIAALKRMSRRPVIGDLIHYQIHSDNKGKTKAVNARIEGVSEVQHRVKRKVTTKRNNNTWLSKILTIVVLTLIGFVVYDKFIDKNKIHIPSSVSKFFDRPVQKTNHSFSCKGKVHCSEMASCEEAMFYQNNCPGTKMDGDGDGISCESQWCGY
jgi:cold shock CspA family protein